MNYNDSKVFDQRKSFIKIYLSFLRIKQPLFFLFNYYPKKEENKYQIKFNTLKLIMFCYEILIYLFIYSSFFGSKSISKIYFDSFNFGKKCILGIIIALFAMIIKSIIYFLVYDYSFQKKIIEVKIKIKQSLSLERSKKKRKSIRNRPYADNNNIRERDGEGEGEGEGEEVKENEENELNKEVEKIIDYLKIRLIFFCLGTILVLIFELLLITSFCAVYKNSQSEFFISILVSYGLANIVEFFYCLIPACLRYLANNKDSETFFKIAKIAKII